MAVEFAAERATNSVFLAAPAIISDQTDSLVIDWRPMLAAMVAAARAGGCVDALVAAFHECLIDSIIAVATRIGTAQVLLTGGCFQNARLTERAAARLRQAGFKPYWHHRVPPNDGGLAVGQGAFAARMSIEEKTRCA